MPDIDTTNPGLPGGGDQQDADRRAVANIAEQVRRFVEANDGEVDTVMEDPDRVILGINLPIRVGGSLIATRVSLEVNVTP